MPSQGLGSPGGVIMKKEAGGFAPRLFCVQDYFVEPMKKKSPLQK